MSNASRTTYLVPLLALSLASACGLTHDEPVEDDELRGGRYSRGGGSGILLNTNNWGEFPFNELKLDRSFYREVRLLHVVNAPFDPSGRPSWEIDDVPVAPQQIDMPNGVLDLHVNANHLLTGMTVGGHLLQHGDFHNSIWHLQIDPAYIPALDAAAVSHDGGGVVEMRLEVGWIHPDGVVPMVPGFSEDSDELHATQLGSIPTYTFYYVKDGEPTSTCSTSLVPGPTHVSAVLYNDVAIDELSGEISFEDDIIQIACLEGAVGKAGGLWGYWPNEVDDESAMLAGDPRENFETTTRVVRADYCADGSSWTVTGTEVELYDVFGHTPADSTKTDYGPDRPTVEAVWGPSGALCLDNQRHVGGGGPSCGIPSCGGKHPAFSMLNDVTSPSLFLTRTTRVWEPNP